MRMEKCEKHGLYLRAEDGDSLCPACKQEELAPDLAKHYADLQARVAAMENVLQACRIRFTEYWQHNTYKGTVDGNLEAARNAKMIDLISDTIGVDRLLKVVDDVYGPKDSPKINTAELISELTSEVSKLSDRLSNISASLELKQDEVVEMWLCESRLNLKPNTFYRFSTHPNCHACYSIERAGKAE